VFIEAKDDVSGGDNWATGAIVVQSSSQIITTNKPTSSFLQAGSLPVAQRTMSKH